MRIVTWIALGAIAGYLARIQVLRMAHDLGTRLSAATAASADASSRSASAVKPNEAASAPA
jgi:hypothetical protein